jgi:hypothetical protein
VYPFNLKFSIAISLSFFSSFFFNIFFSFTLFFHSYLRPSLRLSLSFFLSQNHYISLCVIFHIRVRVLFGGKERKLMNEDNVVTSTKSGKRCNQILRRSLSCYSRKLRS